MRKSSARKWARSSVVRTTCCEGVAACSDFRKVVHFRNRAVGVVALDEQDRVLLVGQYRYTLSQYSWEIAEGGAASKKG